MLDASHSMAFVRQTTFAGPTGWFFKRCVVNLKMLGRGNWGWFLKGDSNRLSYKAACLLCWSYHVIVFNCHVCHWTPIISFLTVLVTGSDWPYLFGIVEKKCMHFHANKIKQTYTDDDCSWSLIEDKLIIPHPKNSGDGLCNLTYLLPDPGLSSSVSMYVWHI